MKEYGEGGGDAEMKIYMVIHFYILVNVFLFSSF